MRNMRLITLLMGLLAITPGTAHGELSRGVQTNNQFGYALAKSVARLEMSRDINRNILVSPVSAAIALQMLLNGTGGGSTAYQELAAALGVRDLALEELNRSNRDLLAQLQAPPRSEPPGLASNRSDPEPVPFTLAIANSAWGDSRSQFKFDPAFVTTLAQSYQAEARSVDFRSPSGAAAINQWASRKTNNKVPEVIDARALERLCFVLMNATYFKANWRTPFDPYLTTESEEFMRADGTEVPVAMMSGRFHGYVETPEAQVMELPYAGGRASMYVVLPKVGPSILSVVTSQVSLFSTHFWEQVERAEKEEAQLLMPRFGFSYEIKLNDPLESLGILSIFTAGADLSRLGQPPAQVDLVKQNTFIKVDEQGTEAAAVTLIGGIRTAILGPVPTMRVDRPFLISIVEKGSGSVLFLGVISNPEAALSR